MAKPFDLYIQIGEVRHRFPIDNAALVDDMILRWEKAIEREAKTVSFPELTARKNCFRTDSITAIWLQRHTEDELTTIHKETLKSQGEFFKHAIPKKEDWQGDGD